MKTVRLDDEAYRILKGLKVSPRDSFSDVVKRHLGEGTGAGDLSASAGGWRDVPDERVAELRGGTVDGFEPPEE